MAKREQRPVTSLPVISDPPTMEQEGAARDSTADTIKSELDRAMAAERARISNLAREYAGTPVQVAPMFGDVTREQEYAAHEDTVAMLISELGEQEKATKPRPKPQGIDDASIELIKSEMKKTRVRVR